jgi:seryl-tRNA synthetase
MEISIQDLEKEWLSLSHNSNITEIDKYQQFVDKFKPVHEKWKTMQTKYEQMLHSENEKTPHISNENTIGELNTFLNEIQTNIQDSIKDNNKNTAEIMDLWLIYKEAYEQLTLILQQKTMNVSYYEMTT